MTITVLTATYNRCELLPVLFKSLVAQDYGEIEWIVVDDGGTDNSSDLVAGMREKAKFKIRYLRTENQGTSLAVNAGLELVTGEIVAVIDDDDYLLPGVFQKISDDYASIAGDESVVGLSYLTIDQQGKTWGERFPQDRMISDHYECRINQHIWGDKCEFTKSRVLRERAICYPTGGMKFGFGGETIFFFKIADVGKTLYVNLPILVKEYRIDGLSVNWRKRALENPQLTAEYYAAHLNARIRTLIRFRYMIAYVAILRFASIRPNRTVFRVRWNRLLYCLAYIPGIWIGTRWKRYQKKGYPLSRHWLTKKQ